MSYWCTFVLHIWKQNHDMDSYINSSILIPVSPKETTQNKLHKNMIFQRSSQLESSISVYNATGFQ